MKKIIIIFTIFVIFGFTPYVNAAQITNNLFLDDDFEVHSLASDFLFDSSLGTLNSVELHFHLDDNIANYWNWEQNAYDTGTFSGSLDYQFFFVLFDDAFTLQRKTTIDGSLSGEGSYDGGWGIIYYDQLDVQTFFDSGHLDFFTLSPNDKTLVVGTYASLQVMPDQFASLQGDHYRAERVPLPSGSQFTVYYDYNPVPEPATCLLFFFGILGMVGVKKLVE